MNLFDFLGRDKVELWAYLNRWHVYTFIRVYLNIRSIYDNKYINWQFLTDLSAIPNTYSINDLTLYMYTQYERNRDKLDSERVIREIISSEKVIARGVSAPYEGTPTPCVTETFSFVKEPDLQYVFTDSLTGCAGLIAVSGDGSPFKPAHAQVIHDKGGDKLESSKKLLEDFIIAQQKEGYTRMRLIWGNGVVKEALNPTHTVDTKLMISQLGQKYPHLDIKNLPMQLTDLPTTYSV